LLFFPPLSMSSKVGVLLSTFCCFFAIVAGLIDREESCPSSGIFKLAGGGGGIPIVAPPMIGAAKPVPAVGVEVADEVAIASRGTVSSDAVDDDALRLDSVKFG